MDADQAAALKSILRIPDEQPIYDALSRGRLSPNLHENLTGLLTSQEIGTCMNILGSIRV